MAVDFLVYHSFLLRFVFVVTIEDGTEVLPPHNPFYEPHFTGFPGGDSDGKFLSLSLEALRKGSLVLRGRSRKREREVSGHAVLAVSGLSFPQQKIVETGRRLCLQTLCLPAVRFVKPPLERSRECECRQTLSMHLATATIQPRLPFHPEFLLHIVNPLSLTLSLQGPGARQTARNCIPQPCRTKGITLLKSLSDIPPIISRPQRQTMQTLERIGASLSASSPLRTQPQPVSFLRLTCTAPR